MKRRWKMGFFFFSSRRRHTRWNCDWSSDVCSSDLHQGLAELLGVEHAQGARRDLAQGLEQLEPAAVPAEVVVHQRRLPRPPIDRGERLVEREDAVTLVMRPQGLAEHPAPPAI